MLTKPASEELKMEHDEVNEATAALKGMLGIGKTNSVLVSLPPTTPREVSEETQFSSVAAGPVTVATDNNVTSGEGEGGDVDHRSGGKQTISKKKKNKKKKPTNNINNRDNSSNKQQHGTEENVSNATKGNVTAAQTAAQVSSNAGKKQKRKNNKKKDSENFAWSAFQSSPDASTLPIPAFPSPAIPDGESKAITNDFGADIKQIVKPALLGIDLSTVVEEGEKSIKTALTGDDTVRESTEIQNAEVSTTVEQNVSDSLKEPEFTKEPADPHFTAPVSKTGVNLAAALAAEPTLDSGITVETSLPVGLRNPLQQQQQLSSLPHQFGSGTINQPQPQLLPLYHQQLPPQFSSLHHQQHHYPHHHHHQYNQQQYIPPPPPGYITIQVQVPPVLMPGRQMVVTSPAGYPVQVVVPEGIPPGMIIPVHVPIGPPMHMMPPPPPPPTNYGRFYGSNSNDNNSQQQHQQSGHQHRR